MIATISRNLHFNRSIPTVATPSTRHLHSHKSKPIRSKITKPKPTTTTTPKSTPSTSTSGRTGKFSKPKRIPSIKPNQRDDGFFTAKFKSYHHDDPSKGIRISKEIELEQEQDLDDEIDTQIDLQIGNGNGNGNGEIKPFPRPKLKVNSFLKKKLDDESSVRFNSSTVSDFENPFLNTALRKESLLEEKRRKSRNYVSVIIDADNYWFNLDLVNQGREGGFKAINLLRSKISNHLGIPDTKEEQSLDLRVYCFANLRGLATTFSRRGYIEDKACFAQFVRIGVSLSGSHCFFSDTGPSQESADSKVRAWLVDSLLDQDCQHVYLGGLDDLSYSNDLVGLQRLDMLDRVSLLNIPPLAKKLMNPITKQMFLERKVDWDTSEIFVTSQSYDTKENRSSKHFDVMPCIYYHLSEDGCVKSDSACFYSHEPLSPEELERLRSKIKHRICPFILRREICPKGRNCIFHHPS